MKALVAILLLCSSLFVRMQNVEPTFEYTDAKFEVGSIHVLPIRYYYGKATMIEDSLALAALAELEKFAQTHINLKLQLEHHTDMRGSDTYNQKLSQIRIQSVLDYLIAANPVNHKQFTAKGMGESRPIYDQQLIESMSSTDEQEAAYAANRRTLVRIIEIQ